MRLAIFGAGSIGSRHAANAMNRGVSSLIIYDPVGDPRYHPDTFDARGVGAVMICSPSSTHADVARLLRERQYFGPLFVEKPLVLSSADADVFTTWPHRTTMVGYNWRFHPEVAPLGAIARRGCTVHFDCRTDIRTWPGAGYGDPLLECSHEVDLACAWLGDPTAITGGGLDVDEGAWLQLQHPHGDAIIDVRWRQTPARTITLHLPAPAPGIAWRGSHGSVLARFDVSKDARGLRESYELELQHFLDVVRYGRPTAVPFSQGLRVVEICERVKERGA